MNFTHYDLGHKSGGEVVLVTLSGNSANIRLLDNSNFQSYKSGRQHRYFGGHVKHSPVQLQIPRSGHWHVVVDLGGLSGSVRASINVLPRALPAM